MERSKQEASPEKVNSAERISLIRRKKVMMMRSTAD